MLEAVTNEVEYDIDSIPMNEPHPNALPKTTQLKKGPMVQMRETPRLFLSLKNSNSNLEIKSLSKVHWPNIWIIQRLSSNGGTGRPMSLKMAFLKGLRKGPYSRAKDTSKNPFNVDPTAPEAPHADQNNPGVNFQQPEEVQHDGDVQSTPDRSIREQWKQLKLNQVKNTREVTTNISTYWSLFYVTNWWKQWI